MSDGIRRAFGVRESPELGSADDALAELKRRGFRYSWVEDGRVWGRKETVDGVVTLTWSSIRWEPVWAAAMEGGRNHVGWTAQEAVDELVRSVRTSAVKVFDGSQEAAARIVEVFNQSGRIRAAFEGVGHE